MGGIRVCFELKGSNDSFVHGPFPTPLNDEVLDYVEWKETYYFIDVFLEHHQVGITKEDKNKTTFSIT